VENYKPANVEKIKPALTMLADVLKTVGFAWNFVACTRRWELSGRGCQDDHIPNRSHL